MSTCGKAIPYFTGSPCTGVLSTGTGVPCLPWNTYNLTAFIPIGRSAPAFQFETWRTVTPTSWAMYSSVKSWCNSTTICCHRFSSSVMSRRSLFRGKQALAWPSAGIPGFCSPWRPPLSGCRRARKRSQPRRCKSACRSRSAGRRLGARGS